MANEAYTRTNQALFFARKAIESWQQAESSNALDALTQALSRRPCWFLHPRLNALRAQTNEMPSENARCAQT